MRPRPGFRGDDERLHEARDSPQVREDPGRNTGGQFTHSICRRGLPCVFGDSQAEWSDRGEEPGNLRPGSSRGGVSIESIQGRNLLEGYRGKEPLNKEKLAELIVAFSQMAFDLRDAVESIDLNPVLCDREKAIIADARFMLKN